MEMRKLMIVLALMVGASFFKAQTMDLFQASKELRPALVEDMLKNGSNPNVKDDYGLSPLYYACQSAVDTTDTLTAIKTVKTLLDYGADANTIYGTSRHKGTLLWLLLENDWPREAAFRNSDVKLEIAELLLKEGRADASFVNHNGDSLVYFAARNRTEGPQFIELLVRYRAEVNRQNNNGNTALHEAITKGNCAAVEVLMASGANPNLRNNRSKSPQDLAIENHSPCMHRLLPGMPLLAPNR